MRKAILFLLLFVSVCYAKNISQPPVDKQQKTETQQFLKNVSDNFNNLTVVTTNPNGNRRGKYGDVVLLYYGGNYYEEVCVSSPNGTTWFGVQLTATP